MKSIQSSTMVGLSIHENAYGLNLKNISIFGSGCKTILKSYVLAFIKAATNPSIQASKLLFCVQSVIFLSSYGYYYVGASHVYEKPSHILSKPT